MTRIGMGIHLHSEPGRLAATLAWLKASTPEPHKILLLPDGPDAEMRRALAAYPALPCAATDDIRGAAACFNRMLRTVDADLLVFLEAGSLPATGWLGHLQRALDADPRHGLAGPSTNRAWNRQAVFPAATEAGIAATAELAAERFGTTWQSLEPLHCLADFCYVLRRDVAMAIGEADEAYGAGPCWEMDYTLRAARAGFRAVWAGASYVFRRPFTARRMRDEARLMAANRALYQSKFCGLRLDDATRPVSPHCRGEACAHFAPPARIQIRLQQARATRISVAAGQKAAARTDALVTCIMPTRNRHDWVIQSIKYFMRQDYPQRELVIIDDGEVDRSGELPPDERIQYVHVRQRLSIGAKRNRACALAKGSIIVHWDDDDWHAPHRLTAQTRPILDGNCDITALSNTLFFDLGNWAFWRCAAALYNRMFVHGVHGGTLAYRREIIEKAAQFPETSLAEDAVFLRAALARGARLQALPGADLFIYLRHGGNAWAFACGTYLDRSGWERLAEATCMSADRDFYANRSAACAARGTVHPPALPRVSCIMPTHNRRIFAGKALDYFARQDYPNAELVIVDDGDDGIADLASHARNVRYIRLPSRTRLGAKRNMAIEAGTGDIILHWDDDDWMHASRISKQVSALVSGDGDICGSGEVRFCEISSGRLSLYRYMQPQRHWLYGATLCYRRSLWRQKPFAPIDIGEDTRFVWEKPLGRSIDLAGLPLLIAMVHGGNISNPRPGSGANWQVLPETASDALGADWPFYENVACTRKKELLF